MAVGDVLQSAPNSLRGSVPKALPIATRVAPAADRLMLQAEQTVGHRLKVTGGVIEAATETRTGASPKALLEALLGDWNRWWALGAASDRKLLPGGGRTFDFRPMALMGFGPMHAGVELGAAQKGMTADGRELIRVPLHLFHDLAGHGYFEFEGRKEGGSLIRAVWEHVRPTGLRGIWPLPKVIGEAHMIVEDAYLKALGRYARALSRVVR